MDLGLLTGLLLNTCVSLGESLDFSVLIGCMLRYECVINQPKASHPNQLSSHTRGCGLTRVGPARLGLGQAPGSGWLHLSPCSACNS